MVLSLTFQKSANNELRLRLMDAPVRSRKTGDGAKEKSLELLAKVYEDSGTEIVQHPNFVLAVNPSTKLCRRIEEDEIPTYRAAQSRALDIIREFQQRKKRYASSRIDTVNRPVRFTRKARHTILEGGAVLARLSPNPECSAFITLTLPGDTDAGYKELASYSGYLCNRLTQVLRRQCSDALWFYSWELQGRGALHLHFVVWTECPKESLRLGGLLRDKWIDCLKSIGADSNSKLCQHRSGKWCWLPNTWQNDVVSVNKSVANYVSKYVSKGSDGRGNGGKGFGRGVGYPPKRWWGMSRALLRQVKSVRLKVSLEQPSRDVANDCWAIANQWVERFQPIKGYAYDFKVNFSRGVSDGSSLAGNLNKSHDIEGFEIVYYFESSSFKQVEFWLPNLIRYIASMQPRMSAIGDVCKAGIASMQRVPLLYRKNTGIGHLTKSGIMLA